jgi:predicted GH43/DUF377 family glycosyl hydrolase
MVVGLVLCVPVFTVAQTEWVDDPAEPVLAPGGSDDWDSGAFYPTALLEVDGIYHLYYTGHRDGAGWLEEIDIGHATSTDGIVWVKDPANPVLTRGSAGEWDDLSLMASTVIHDGSLFRMWFQAEGEATEGFFVGYATSPDGSVWTKHPDNPIMAPGPTGTFDAGGVGPQSVIVQDGLHRMWYIGSPVSPRSLRDTAIGYAESDDGLSWTRRPEPVLEPTSGWESYWLAHPSVRFDGSRYQMWYTGATSGHVAIGYAVSSDGIEWKKNVFNPVVGADSQNGHVLYRAGSGTHEMWYLDLEEPAVQRAVSDCCSTVQGLMIPAAAYAAGAEGSFYETDLDLSNPETLAVEYRFTWLPRGVSNGEPVRSEFFTLGPGRSVRYSNVLAEVFDLEPDMFGALMIEASSPDLLAMARIANLPPDAGEGSFGQSIPPVAVDDFSGLRVKRRLLFGTENADMRFNVGCVNIDTTAARVSFELFSTDGTLLGTESLILMPWSNDQINRIFDPYHPVTGYVDFWSGAASGKIYCYGSVLDNVTSDPTTVPPM